MIRRGLLALPALLIAGAAFWWWYAPGSISTPPARFSPDSLGSEVEALARQFPEPGAALPDWPEALGSQAEHFTESWLVAGLLRDASGRRYGFHLALDRVALAPQPVDRRSSWATRDLFRGTLSIEPETGETISFERLSRAALELAGAERDPARAWLEDWQFVVDDSGRGFQLLARADGAGLSLQFQLPPEPPGEISHELYSGYWQLPLAAEGQIEVAGQPVDVTGTALIERLWGRAQPAGRGQLAMARLWVYRASGASVRCDQLQRRGGGGAPLLDCFGYPAGRLEQLQLEADARGWRTIAGASFPLRWTLGSTEGLGPLSLHPLAAEHAVFLDGSWRGILRVEGHEGDWGLLVLSNFAAP